MLTPIFNLHDIVLILTIGLSFILALFQPVLPVRNIVTKKLLAIFFISLTVSHICIMLIWNIYLELSSAAIILVPYFYVASLVLKGPALSLYVRSITEEKFKLRRYHLIHVLPMLAIFAILIFFKIDLNDMRYNNDHMPRTLELATNTVWYAIKVIPLLYFIAAVVTVFRYRKRLQEHYSEINEPALNWLYYLTLGFVVTGAWTLGISLITFFFRFPLGITDNYLNLLLVIALFYYSISHAQTLTKTKQETEPPADTPVIDKPLDSIIKKIVDGIEKDKLYLNQTINIEQFSKKIGVPYRVVSYAINKQFGTNFFEFINSHRIEEAKRLLSDKAYEHLTVLEILMESGFNSKSSFQRFFKRLTNLSPTEFRKNAFEAQNVEIAQSPKE